MTKIKSPQTYRTIEDKRSAPKPKGKPKSTSLVGGGLQGGLLTPGATGSGR